MYVIWFSALMCDLCILWVLSKVLSTYVLLLELTFIMHESYMFAFKLVQCNRACAKWKGFINIDDTDRIPHFTLLVAKLCKPLLKALTIFPRLLTQNTKAMTFLRLDI